jgi:RNA ligase
MDDLVLLTAIEHETGKEFIEDIGFPIVKRYDGITDLQQLKTLQEENKEGFVVRFKNGFRVKIKFAEYIRLHRICTGISNIDVWEYLKEGKPFDELISKVPDEFYNWLMLTANTIEMNYKLIFECAQKRYMELWNEDKKTFAQRVMREAKDISAILFNMYNGKKFKPLIWRMVRPAYRKTFKNEKDENYENDEKTNR